MDGYECLSKQPDHDCGATQIMNTTSTSTTVGPRGSTLGKLETTIDKKRQNISTTTSPSSNYNRTVVEHEQGKLQEDIFTKISKLEDGEREPI